MQYLHSLILALALVSCGSRHDTDAHSAVHPIIDVPFGTSSTATVRIVGLDNSYFDQNMSKEKFKVEILSLRNVALRKSFLMHPICDDRATETYEIGKVYEVDCFEQFNSTHAPLGWDQEMQQMNFIIERFLVIRKIKTAGNTSQPSIDAMIVSSTRSALIP